MTTYVLFLKLFKDCSDISIFWQEKTTCYFKKSSCYDALFTDCRTFRDRLDKRGRYKVRISETERHARHGASMRGILKFTPRTPRCLACYETQISGSCTKILSLSTFLFSVFRVNWTDKIASCVLRSLSRFSTGYGPRRWSVKKRSYIVASTL